MSVWVSDYNAPVGTGTVSGREYSAKAFKYGGAFAGKTLIFKIADKDMGTTAKWGKRYGYGSGPGDRLRPRLKRSVQTTWLSKPRCVGQE